MVKIKLFDIVIVLVLLLVSLVPLTRLAFSDNTPARVKITEVDKVTYYPLNEDREEPIDSNGYSLTVVISGGKARISSSSCADKLCVHSGSISKDGSAIVCLPAGVVVEIVSSKEALDAVAG